MEALEGRPLGAMVAEKWYRLRAAAVVKQLQSDEKRGLTEKEAARRLRQYGPNELELAPLVSGWEIFWAQFQDFMILVLMGATAISFLLGEVVDAIAILAIVFVNAILGFIQEYRAERSLQALQELAAPYTLVTRDGKALQIDSRELIPGDIVTLEGRRPGSRGHSFAPNQHVSGRGGGPDGRKHSCNQGRRESAHR